MCQKLNFVISPGTYKYRGTVRFIDDLCAINDANECLKSFKNIYSRELELNGEYQGAHATFLDHDITIKDNIFL